MRSSINPCYFDNIAVEPTLAGIKLNYCIGHAPLSSAPFRKHRGFVIYFRKIHILIGSFSSSIVFYIKISFSNYQDLSRIERRSLDASCSKQPRNVLFPRDDVGKVSPGRNRKIFLCLRIL